MKKMVFLFLIAVILFSFGCISSEKTEPTGKAFAVKTPVYSKEDYGKAFQEFAVTKKTFPFLKKISTSYKISNVMYYSDVTEKISSGNPDSAKGVEYNVLFDSPIIFSDARVRIVWFHESAELIPLNSEEIIIIRNGKEIRLENLSQYKGKWNTEFLFNTDKTALKGIKIYNTSALVQADYIELYS